MDRQLWKQIEEAFTQAHSDGLDADAFSVAVAFVEDRVGRELTMDEFRMAMFFYGVGNRRGCEAMRAIHTSH